MATFPSVAFIGGGNMANALVSGMLAQGCPAEQIHVVEVVDALQTQWRARSVSVAERQTSCLVSDKFGFLP